MRASLRGAAVGAVEKRKGPTPRGICMSIIPKGLVEEQFVTC
jgi:hypothetical protein